MRSAFGHIRKHTRGKYRVFWTEHGHKRSKVVNSHKEATEYLARVRMKNGYIDSTITYEQYYKNVLLPSYKHVSKSTQVKNEYEYGRLREYIGDVKVADTNWRMVQNVLDNFESASFQLALYRWWKKTLNIAIRDEIIYKNPCDTSIKLKQVKPKEKVIYTREQLIDILKKIDGTRFALPVLLECCCGLRHEEYCGLDKRDLDFKDNGCVFISITKAVTDPRGKKVLKETKTPKSERMVVLDGRFIDYLCRNAQDLKNKRSVKEYEAPRNLTKRWRAYCQKHDILYTPFGVMRSVYATLSAEAGCLDSIVSMSMGHSSSQVSTKQKHYQSLTSQSLKLNAKNFADYILEIDSSF